MSDKSANNSTLRRIWDTAGMLIICILMFIGCSIFVPNFASVTNMNGLALAITTTGLLACTMLFCLASGHFDLSIGSIVACAGVLAAVVMNKSGSIGIGITAGLALGLSVGIFNGVIISKLKINALITTLATMQIVRGLGYIISDGKAVGISKEGFFALGIQQFAGIPVPVLLMVVAFILFGLLMQNTVFGRNTLALGGNEEAARLAGINVDGLKIKIFAIQGLMAGFAGIVLASRMTSGQPMTSQGLELEVISACVLGGVSLTGGVGTMVAVVSGVLIMGAMQNAMNLLNVPAFWQYVARGAILLAAVLFDRFKQK